MPSPDASDRTPTLPRALDHWSNVRRRIEEAGGCTLCLDYDGTLSPIVSRPELATLAEPMRARVLEAAGVHPTAIVSGRDVTDLRERVGVPDLYYMGCHGLQIRGPKIAHDVFGDVDGVARLVQAVRAATSSLDGVVVEPKQLTVAIHVRLSPPGVEPRVDAILDELLARHPGFRKTHGKKVFELRPDVEWDKGHAVMWLVDAIPGARDRPVVYVGDDRTDEDAFRRLRDVDVGVRVTDVPAPTAATYGVANTNEVAELLDRLAKIERGA